MPKALALTIRTRVLNRGLKGGVFAYKRQLFIIWTLERGNEIPLPRNPLPHFPIQQPQ